MSRWLQFYVVVCAVLLIILATAVVAKLSIDIFEKELNPAEQQKAAIVSQSLANLVDDMLAYGIPGDRFRGMDDIFARIQKKFPNISYIAIEDSDNSVLYERAKTSETQFNFFSVAETSGKSTGYEAMNVEHFASKVKLPEASFSLTAVLPSQVRVGIDRHYFLNKQKEILLDIVTVLVVSMLMAIELLVFLFVFTIKSPMKRLQLAMQAISQRKFSVVYEFNTPDEVGRCGRLLNQIIVKVNQGHFATREPTREPTGEPVSKLKSDNARKLVADSLVSADPAYAKSGTTRSAECSAAEMGERGKLRCVYDQALIYMRPPLFMVIFAESMSLSFFPDYVDHLYAAMKPLPLSKELVMGLPISIFMLIWALSLPFAGQWSDRVGRRKAFVGGAILTAVGLVLTSQSGDIYQLVLWRSITALGYGIVFITAQSYVTDLTTPANRTKGMAIFLSGFFSGSLCGAAIGGILADRIGFAATFILSAALATAASLFAARFFVDHLHDNQQISSKLLVWQDIKKLFADRSFIVITFLAAIPAKAALTGFIYYIGPVYSNYLGATKSVSGRILMAYGLAIVIISPLTAWLTDKYQQQKSFIVVGGLLSSSALLIVGISGNMTGLGIGVLLLGVAHACSISPQSSLITATVVQSAGVAVGKTIGIYRLTERIGNIAGPIVAGVLIASWDFATAFITFSVFLGASSVLFLFLLQITKPSGGVQQEPSHSGNMQTMAQARSS
jgi:predicted MFS family arabinose efflux permease